jgi:hypothetical protein
VSHPDAVVIRLVITPNVTVVLSGPAAGGFVLRQCHLDFTGFGQTTTFIRYVEDYVDLFTVGP